MSAGLPNPISFVAMQHSPTKAGDGVSTRPSARAHMQRYSGVSNTPRVIGMLVFLLSGFGNWH